MKCPRCWAEKAYLRQVTGWQRVLCACLLLAPLKCHHCYHKFTVPRLFCLGKRLVPPPARASSADPPKPSYASRRHAAMYNGRRAA